MADDVMIKVDQVNKTFRLPRDRSRSIKGSLINIARHRRGYEKQQALEGISFEVKKGEFFGIVGRNGSGKSTLLKLLAGIYTPDSGSIQVSGSLTPFIELGVGFNPELTGRENVYLNGALLGFSRKEMNEMYDDIVEFAELERFMGQKLKNYSSGMQVRLAFSIAIRAQSQILVLDEVLAVGDAAFQKKCYDHFMLLKKDQQTVVLVTHDMGAIRQYCDRAIMIDNGKVVDEGDPESIAQAYQRQFSNELKHEKQSVEVDEQDKHWGSGKMLCLKPKVAVHEDTVLLSCTYTALQDIPAPIVGFTVFGPAGNNILEGNTKRIKYKTDTLRKNDQLAIEWAIPNIFATGEYSVSVACCDQSATDYYDWYNDAAGFDIFKEGFTSGVVDPLITVHEYHILEK